MARKRTSMVLKLVSVISVSMIVIFIALFSYSYYFTRRILLSNINDRANEVLSKNINEIEKVLTDITTPARDLAPIFSRGGLSETEVVQLLSDPFSYVTGAYGYWTAYEPYKFEQTLYYLCLDVWTDGKNLHTERLGSADYDYFNLHWYKKAKDNGKPTWSEPYYDVGNTGKLMTSFAVPYYREVNGGKEMIGVVGTDLALEWLQELISKVKVAEAGYAFLISGKGTFIAHPLSELIEKETMFTAAEKLHRPYLDEAGRRMTNGEAGSMDIISSVTNRPARLFFAPMPKTGWSMGIVIMEDELLAGVRQLHHRLLTIGVFGFLLIIVVIVSIARKMSRPLVVLTSAAVAFSEGDMNVADINIRTGDEIEDLNTAFNGLKSKLRQKMEELKEYSVGLENKVAERTKEIAAKNEELQKAMENLTRAQERLIQQEKLASLGGLTAGIAHEIKNPLNFVTNFSDITTELVDELSELISKQDGLKNKEECLATLKDIRSNVAKISEHGRRADSIVKGMLMHSRGKSGEQQDVDIASMLTESVNLAYHGFRAKDHSFNVSMTTDIAKDLPKIKAVPQDISRVFLNIIDNAFYSVHEKFKLKRASYSPEFSVSAALKDNMVVIKLRDNGLGVPSDIVQKIFNPFFTTKPAGSGTGLGLSISYDIIVKQHRGELTLDTKSGEYAEFTIKLPM